MPKERRAICEDRRVRPYRRRGRDKKTRQGAGFAGQGVAGSNPAVPTGLTRSTVGNCAGGALCFTKAVVPFVVLFCQPPDPDQGVAAAASTGCERRIAHLPRPSGTFSPERLVAVLTN